MIGFVVAGVRVTHREVGVGGLEAARHPDPEARLAELAAAEGVEEAAVLQTCNRVEEYAVAESPGDARAALSTFPGVDAAVETGHEESLRHLLRVAAGLESQVLGEDEILGQVREAYRAADEAGTLGPVLETGLLKAIHVGERARAETAINEGVVSLGSAAVELAEREVGLAGRTALVVGAGEMARTVARGLADAGVEEMRVVNRTPGRAERFAAEAPAPARGDGLDRLAEHLRAADVAVTATGSDAPVIDARTARDARGTLLIDLGQPRDVAPDAAAVEGVEVRDLEALRAVTDATHEERREAAREVEAVVDEEFDLLMDGYKRRRADAVIAGMHRGAERIKRQQLSRAKSRLEGHVDEEGEAIVEEFADALVSRLLAAPTGSLREAAGNDDWETITTAIDLFDPELDAEEWPDALVPAAGADARE